MMRMRHMLIPVLLISCSTRTGNPKHTFRVFEEAGVTISETTGGPKYEGDLFQYEFETSLKQDPQNEESLLFSIRGMTMDRDGNIYVADGRNYRIAVFDREGNYTRSFGRQGSGPGEFRWIEIVQFDGEIFCLWDANNLRMTRYHRDGTLLDIRYPPKQARVASMLLTPDERIITWQTRNEPRNGLAYTSAIVLVFDPAGDTLATIESEQVVTGTHRITANQYGGVTTEQSSIPFASYPHSEYSPDRGIMFSTGITPEILWYDLTGGLSQVFRIEMEPRRITAEIKQTYEESLRRTIQEYAERTGREPQPVPEQTYPDYAANWRGGFVDDAGFVWLFAMILPGEEKEEEPEGITCFVLDPEGCFLGRTAIPNSRSRAVRGHLFATIENEETGEQIPTVFRISSKHKGLKYP